LTIDFGKWASSLGLESNYTKDQMNYSRSHWFTFLPAYHMGGRVNYRFNDAVALNYWITNGTQQTESFKNFKDQFLGVVLQPAKSLTWTAQYYLGQEQPDVESRRGATQPRRVVVVPVDRTAETPIFDTYATWQPSPAITVGAEADVVSQNQTPPDSRFRRCVVASGAGGAGRRSPSWRIPARPRRSLHGDDAVDRRDDGDLRLPAGGRLPRAHGVARRLHEHAVLSNEHARLPQEAPAHRDARADLVVGDEAGLVVR
jgi:hypothetical protein